MRMTATEVIARQQEWNRTERPKLEAAVARVQEFLWRRYVRVLTRNWSHRRKVALRKGFRFA